MHYDSYSLRLDLNIGASAGFLNIVHELAGLPQFAVQFVLVLKAGQSLVSMPSCTREVPSVLTQSLFSASVVSLKGAPVARGLANVLRRSHKPEHDLCWICHTWFFLHRHVLKSEPVSLQTGTPWLDFLAWEGPTAVQPGGIGPTSKCM